MSNKLLESCNSFIELFRDSDMSPEDECRELYNQMLKAIEEVKKDKGLLVLLGKTDQMSFKVSDEFIAMLRQVAKNRRVRTTTVFKELIELMTEELYRELS